MEVLPYSRLVYYDMHTKQLWNERIKRINEAFNKLELETFLRDHRKLYIYHVVNTRFEDSYKFLADHDLIYYPTNKSALYSGFSHKHLPVVEGKPYMLYGGVVKRQNKKILDQFIKANSDNDHLKIGELLGYPKCCTKFFNKVWYTESIDPMFEAARNTKGSTLEGNIVKVKVHPYCNQMLRYFGIRITPHLPCSFQCEETIKMGDQWFKIFKDIDEDAASWAYNLLSMPITWNCYMGYAIIDTPLFKGITNSDLCKTYKIIQTFDQI